MTQLLRIPGKVPNDPRHHTDITQEIVVCSGSWAVVGLSRLRATAKPRREGLISHYQSGSSCVELFKYVVDQIYKISKETNLEKY